MSARRLLAIVVMGLLTALLGCSWLVDPHDAFPRCAPNDAGVAPCPEGLQCQEGRCRKLCSVEVCQDNVDNDCDGEIDERDALGLDTCGDGLDNDCDGTIDEGSDADGDGFTWCGNTRIPDAGRDEIDCDDFRPQTRPHAREECDGRDDDCDGTIDEEPEDAPICGAGRVCSRQRCLAARCTQRSDCDADQLCSAETGRCEATRCTDDSCEADQYCDATSGTCRERVPQPNGARCTVDADCISNTCLDAAALRLASSERVCGHACCSDADCGEGERCFASGTGARSCLPESMLPSGSPHHCSTDGVCKTGEQCGLSRDQTLSPPVFATRKEVVTSTCRSDRAQNKKVGERCSDYTECASRLCLPGGLYFGFLCSSPCGTSGDCAKFGQAARVGSGGAYCRYVDVVIDNAPADFAPVCIVKLPSDTGPGRYGAECSSGRDCQEGGCVGATSTRKGHCTPSCCTDAQCTRDDGRKVSCRPFAFGARYEMRCGI